MEQTYEMPTLRIVLLNSEDVVRTSGTFGTGNEYETNGQYDGSNIWNGF